jgi:hypothetical protein
VCGNVTRRGAIKSNHRRDTRLRAPAAGTLPDVSENGHTTLPKGRLDLRRIALATALAAGLGVGFAVAFLRHAQSTSHVGPTSATLDEAFSSFLGAGIGLALGSALGALSIRRGSRLAAGVIAGLAAYVLVLAPLFVITDDVSLAEDLNSGGLVFLAFLAFPFGIFVFVGALVGGFIGSKWVPTHNLPRR